MSSGLRHYYSRKRARKISGQLPASLNKWKRFLDNAVCVVGVLGPIMTLPQVFKIWIEHQAEGLSVITWGSYILFDIFWLAYGAVHREKPILLTYASWILINSLVIAGIFLYSPQPF